MKLSEELALIFASMGTGIGLGITGYAVWLHDGRVIRFAATATFLSIAAILRCCDDREPSTPKSGPK